MPLNINGRICFYYSIFWGILAIFLMKAIHPRVRNLMAFILKKSSAKFTKMAIIIISVFLAVDCILSGYAINLFTIRMIAENDLNVANKEIIYEMNDRLHESKLNSFLMNTLFNDEKMIKTYPNLKVQQLDGTMVYFKDLLPDIKPYLFRFQEQDFYK